jgi:hypothetical protein
MLNDGAAFRLDLRASGEPATRWRVSRVRREARCRAGARSSGVALAHWHNSIRNSPKVFALSLFYRSGTPLARTSRLDGIAGPRQLHVDDVLHQAFIGIDESGTPAAAATAVIFDTGGAPPHRSTCIADRPFLVFMRDDSGALLFAGQVTEPTP